MRKRPLIDELLDESEAAWIDLRSLWAQYVWPIVTTVWIFFVLAAPLIVVILVLWYLDSTGWQSGNSFYTIGSAAWVHPSTLLG